MCVRFLLMIPLAVLLAATSGAAAERPNVVLLMADDHGWGETGYNGHPHVQTPVLDEMARTGLRLDRFYAGSAVCSPTRASVMTGRHANRSGVFSFNYSTRPEEITLPQVLQQAGYRTGINIPAGNMNGTVYDNRFFGNSIADIVCDEPSTVISLLP
jgi:hypothetical protein